MRAPLSPKGAQGVDALMRGVGAYGVSDPVLVAQSIDAPRRHIKTLMRRYKGDLVLVAARLQRRHRAVERYGACRPTPKPSVRRKGPRPCGALSQRPAEALAHTGPMPPRARRYVPPEPDRAEVMARRGPAVTKFGAPWCGHCFAAQGPSRPRSPTIPTCII
jgi:hypothetical protein